MKRKNQSSFRNSDLARAKTNKHVFRALINHKLKRHRSDTGLVEDRTNSVTVVRLIIGLLLIHLIVIGGVILRGKIKSGEVAPIAATTITPPPAPPTPVQQQQQQPQVNNDVLPQPVEGPVANPVRQPQPVAAASHITQAPVDSAPVATVTEPEIVAPVVATEPEPVATPEPAPAPTAAPAAPAIVKHHVTSGDTLYRIAQKYNVSVADIRSANPQLRGNNIISGTYLNIPVAADSAEGRQVAVQQATETANEEAKYHTIRRGETLGAIARRNRIPLNKLLELNNIPASRAGNIRIGDRIRISE